MGNQQSSKQKQQDLEKRLSTLKRGSEIVGNTKNCQLVKNKVCDALLHRNVRRLRNFCSDDAVSIFDGADRGISIFYSMDALEHFHESFPDWCVTFDEIKEIKQDVIQIKNFRMRGTHTGTPFSFGQYPPIPTSGKCVDENPYDITVILSNDKLRKLIIHMHDEVLVGVAGFYVQIGGKMDLDKPTENAMHVA